MKYINVEIDLSDYYEELDYSDICDILDLQDSKTIRELMDQYKPINDVSSLKDNNLIEAGILDKFVGLLEKCRSGNVSYNDLQAMLETVS